MKHKGNKKKEPRNLGVTVLSGTLAVVLMGIAFSDDSIIYFLTFTLLAIIALAVAIYGRKNMLKKLVEKIIDLPM